MPVVFTRYNQEIMQPIIQLASYSSANGNSNNVIISYPSGIKANDFLIIAGSQSTSNLTATPSGWTNDWQTASHISISKVAVGTETGDVILNYDAIKEYAFVMHVFRPDRTATFKWRSLKQAFVATNDGTFTFNANINQETNIFLYQVFNINDRTIDSQTPNIIFIDDIGGIDRFGAFYYGFNIGEKTEGITTTTTGLNIRCFQYSARNS